MSRLDLILMLLLSAGAVMAAVMANQSLNVLLTGGGR